jgi:hypothetical protein
MTKLKTQKTFLKRPRMKINNKKIQGLKLKKKKDKQALSLEERENKEKEKKIIGNKPLIIHCHMSH